ncbi:HvfA family oxazolone/thioamide-modified RiPP metallophore [Neisseria chenwenguii]|uniref:Uncharacterized protein n=1 Tax=Neisseria chenwenguii TaxID=1853278 RepID=A0A220S280_9NEIS|nr:hypothetical protein BG910_05675 [Neisseria chenwenguii]ROV57030.1 hypothetical protein EGS38_02485 [Neisseria chenwenguii]
MKISSSLIALAGLLALAGCQQEAVSGKPAVEAASHADKSAEGKCGEGKCGASHSKNAKSAEGKCGEGKCGSK